MKRVIPIDHGNRLMKTVGQAFPSSYMESKYLPSIGGDVLSYEGKTYTLVDQCLPVLSDKTEDERYFILSLIAIGKELADDAELMRTLTPHDHIKVELLIGLPLQHYEAYRKKFERYFTDRNGIIQFELNSKPYSIRNGAALHGKIGKVIAFDYQVEMLGRYLGDTAEFVGISFDKFVSRFMGGSKQA